MSLLELDAVEARYGPVQALHGITLEVAEGEVVAVGPGARDEAGKLIPSDLKAGDQVLFGKWSGTEVKIDGEELLIMKESDVMGVLEGAMASRKAA